MNQGGNGANGGRNKEASDGSPPDKPEESSQSDEWPGIGDESDLLDPNLVDIERPDEIDEGLEAAVANLRDARAEVHDRDVQKRREQRDAKALEEQADIPLAVDPHEIHDRSNHPSDEEVLRRGQGRPSSKRRSKGRRDGALSKWVTYIVLACAISWGSTTVWLHLDASKHDRSFAESFDKRIVVAIEDAIAGESDRFSTEGIEIAIVDLGWEPKGGEVTTETKHGTRLQKRYQKGDDEVEVFTYLTSSHADARKLAEEELDATDRVVRFDTKVVEVVPIADTSDERVMQVVDRLEQFHKLIAEKSADGGDS